MFFVLFVCYGCTFMCVCRYMFCCLDWGGGGTKGVKSSVFCTCVSCTSH